MNSKVASSETIAQIVLLQQNYKTMQMIHELHTKWEREATEQIVKIIFTHYKNQFT